MTRSRSPVAVRFLAGDEKEKSGLREGVEGEATTEVPAVVKEAECPRDEGELWWDESMESGPNSSVLSNALNVLLASSGVVRAVSESLCVFDDGLTFLSVRLCARSFAFPLRGSRWAVVEELIAGVEIDAFSVGNKSVVERDSLQRRPRERRNGAGLTGRRTRASWRRGAGWRESCWIPKRRRRYSL